MIGLFEKGLASPELQGSLGVARRLVQSPLSLFRGGKMMIDTKAKEMYGDEKKLKDRVHW